MAVPEYQVNLVSSDGATTYDVSAYVRSVSIDRGRSRELDKFEAGTFSVNFDNRLRYFDPKYTDSTTRVNLHPNPSVSVNTSGYGSFGFSLSSSTLYPKYGATNLLATCTSTGTQRYVDYSSRIAVTQGNTYTFSVDIYFPGANAGSSTVQVQLFPHNGTSFGAATSSASQVIVRGSWTRMSVTATATTVSGLPTTSMLPRVLITSSFPSGDTMHLDGNLFEQSATAGTYFDGDSTDTNYQFYSWDGTAGLSTSTLLQYNNPFYGLIVPNLGVQVLSEGYGRIWGFIKDWNLTYDISGESIAVASGADAFSFLSQQQTTADLSSVEQTAGNRIGYVLSQPEVVWPYGGVSYALDTIYTIPVQSHTISKGTNILEYAQLVERTEGGFFFMNSGGQIEFQRRGYGLLSDVVLTDDGSDIQYQGVNIVYGTELLYNQVTLERLGGGTPVTQTNPESIAAYGNQAYADSGLLYVDDATLEQAALFLVAQYGEPEYRFESVTVMLNPLTNTDINRILSLDICSIVQVKFTPNSIGSSITKYARVIGMSEDLQPDAYFITLKLETLDNQQFTLDSDVSGLLDYNVLGF